MRLCVIGDPVGHSLSPLLHRRMLDRAGLTGSYETVTVTPDTLPEFLAAARAGAWDGCNVTMPLKQAILPLLDELDPAAAACRAVNTVCFRRGLAVGYNTDAPGIRAGLLAHGADPRAGQVLIIGNGGAARAARFALGDCRLLTAARHGGDIPLDRLPRARRCSTWCTTPGRRLCWRRPGTGASRPSAAWSCWCSRPSWPFPASPARPWTGRPSAGTCWRWWGRNKKYTPQSTRDCGVFACV